MVFTPDAERLSSSNCGASEYDAEKGRGELWQERGQSKRTRNVRTVTESVATGRIELPTTSVAREDAPRLPGEPKTVGLTETIDSATPLRKPTRTAGTANCGGPESQEASRDAQDARGKAGIMGSQAEVAGFRSERRDVVATRARVADGADDQSPGGAEMAQAMSGKTSNRSYLRPEAGKFGVGNADRQSDVVTARPA